MTEIRTLHIKLKLHNSDLAEFHCYSDNPIKITRHQLKLSEIEHLIQAAEAGYYTALPEEFARTGQALYHWLDGPDRFLDRAVKGCKPADVIVIAIETQGKLAHLPWEVLHDGSGFFVEQSYPLIVPVRWQDQERATYAPENRPLQVLFMAASPTDVKPVLDFEREEGLILQTTARHPLNLIVEESGELEELKYLVNAYASGRFDIFHLSGHAELSDTGGRFLTESTTGSKCPASSKEIAGALTHMPKMIFLSGCHTAEAGKAGAVPSLCEEMLALGAQMVLGWGRPVRDQEAGKAAAHLYGELSQGHGIIPALARTRKLLLEQGARDWHLLRLYLAGDAPNALVTSPRTPGRKKAKPQSLIKTRFLDEHRRVKVPTREAFVGRRRVIQRSLKALRNEEKVGVILHGMGGLGKSSLAARLCDRLKDQQHVMVYVGKIEEPVLVSRLGEDLDKTIREKILSPDDDLKYRLRYLFNRIETPFLIVLDDFEQNFEHTGRELVFRDGLPVLSVAAKEILDALCFAVQKSMEEGYRHRIIITSRYLWESEEVHWFYSEQLDRFAESDVTKKVNRLEAVKNISKERQKDLKPYAIKVADGNPRLLEWLFEILTQPDLKHEAILDQMAQKETQFRENILAQALLEQQKPELRQMLARMMLYEVAVPFAAMRAVCDSVPSLATHRDRALALGLLEMTPSDEDLFRVPRILAPFLEKDQPKDKKELFQTACATLHEIWWQQKDNPTEEHMFEIHRLALIADNPEIALKLSNRLAALMDQQCRYRDGIHLCRKTIDIAEARLDQDHPDLATGFAWLGSLLQSMGDLQAALPYHEKALELTKKGLGEAHLDFAVRLNNLATLYNSQGCYESAEPLYQQAMAIKKKLLGEDHSDFAVSLNNLAGLYYSQGRYESAEPIYQQAIAINKKVLGEDHPDFAINLNNLALLYKSQGRYEKAELLYRQALAIIKKVLGEDHPDFASNLNNLAELYRSKGRYKEAESFYQQAMAIRKKVLGEDHPSFATNLNNLALLYNSQGRCKEAEPLYLQALAIRKKVLGEAHPDFANSLNNLATLYRSQGRYEEAEQLYRQALAIIKKVLGEEHPSFADSLSNLALLKYNQKQYQESLDLVTSAHKIYQKALGPDHPNTKNALEGIKIIEKALSSSAE